VWQNRDRTEIICPLPGYLASFDPNSGRELWRCDGLGDLFYTNALAGAGVIIGMSGYGGPAIGMRMPAPGETGNLTASHRLWRVEKNTQRIGSGIIHGEHVYMLNENGTLQCIEAKTGTELWKERAAKSVWGSLRLIGDRLYATDLRGTTHVIKPSPAAFERLAENRLDHPEMTRATPAFSDGTVFLRSYEHLYAFRENLPK
jgi:outer membrane protein assembly factor BamB